MVVVKIKGTISTTDMNTIKTSIDGAKTIVSPFGVVTTPRENRAGQRMGALNTGYAEEACKTAEDYTMIVPGTFLVTDMRSRITLFNNLEELENYTMSFVEMIRDTKIQVGMALMDDSNFVLKQARLSSHVVGLADHLAKMEEHYKKTKRPINENTIAKSGTLKLSGVVTGNRLVNTGTTVIQVEGGPELSGIPRELPAMTVNPQDSIVIPAGWTTIVVKNMSADTEAIFTVKTKS